MLRGSAQKTMRSADIRKFGFIPLLNKNHERLYVACAKKHFDAIDMRDYAKSTPDDWRV